MSLLPESSIATKTVVERGYAPLLIGENPLDVERLWQKLLAHIRWYGPQGIAAFALSAVDMALWDIAGKASERPLCELWGAKLRTHVPAMATIHFNMSDLGWTLNECQELQSAGYRIIKGGWGRDSEVVFGLDAKRDLDLVRRIREAIGDGVDLVVDIHASRLKWTLPHAIRMLRELEAYRLRWVEEPLPPLQYRAHSRLRSATTTRVGTGEQEWHREGYLRLIRSDAADVVQIDPGRCLGITGCRQVISLVEAYGLNFSVHAWSGSVQTAAAVHLLASSTCGECLDFKPHFSPVHELVREPWKQIDGCLAVQQAPGLGVDVDLNAVAKYVLA